MYLLSRSDSTAVFELWTGNMLTKCRFGVITAQVQNKGSGSSVAFKGKGLGGLGDNPEVYTHELREWVDRLWTHADTGPTVSHPVSGERVAQ